jgi:hemoglobin
VKDFVEQEVANHERINAFFKNADIPGLERKLYEQICAASGGGCTYSGKDMKTAHAGMNIKQADFDALVEDLVKSLDKFHVKGCGQTNAIVGARTDEA